MDRFKQARPGLEERLSKCPIAGHLKGDIVRVDGMHFTVVKIDSHIDHPVAGKNALDTCVLNPTLNRRNESAIHTLSRERLAEADAGIARDWLYPQRHLSKLPGAARLLFVTIIRVRRYLDCFAETHPWFHQIAMDFEPTAE